MSDLLKAHIALFTVNLIYGANYIIAKTAMKHVGPSGFIFMRVVGALSLFWTIKLFIKEKVSKGDHIRLAICGLFGVCLNQLLFFEGLKLTSVIDASIIMTSNPIMVLVLAAIILREKITGLKLIGVSLGTVGAIMMILTSMQNGSTESGWLGNLFIFTNALSYGLYLVLVKPLMAKYKPITVISWVFLWGTIFVICSPFAVSEFIDIDWGTLPDSAYWSIFYVIVGTTFFAYLLNIYALKIVSPSVSSSYIYLQPFMAVLFTFLYGVLIVSSDPATNIDWSWDKGLYTLLIFAGVYLVSRKKPATA